MLGTNRRTFLSFSALLLAGCGGGGNPTAPPAPAAAPAGSVTASTAPAPEADALPGVVKNPTPLVVDGSETAMVLFNGEALAISFLRPWAGSAGTAIQVRRWATGELIAEHPWTGGMGCAIVKDGVIHIFGNTDWSSPGNKIIHSTLAADFTPSAPVDALLMNAPSAPFKFYNTDVTADANGFRMVVETTAGVFFARSLDLDSWEWHGGQLNAGQYCGCPTIDYIGGVHYLTYLASLSGGAYETRAVKSTDDCFTFTYGKTMLAPDAAGGPNASDVDMVEVGGALCGVYLDGDQVTHANLRKWTYPGTLAQLFAALTS